MNLKVRTKIVFIAAGVLLFAIGTSNLISSYSFMNEYSAELKAKLVILGRTLKSQLERLLALGIPISELVGFEEECQEIMHKYKEISLAMVVDPRGTILFHNDSKQHGKTVLCPVSKLKKEVIEICEAGEKSYQIILPHYNSHGEHIATIILGFPVSYITQKTKSLTIRSLAISLAFSGLGIFFLVITLSAWVTNPLMKLISVIQEIRQRGTDFLRRVEIKSHDEIGHLASAFNQMINDLQKTTVSKDYVDNILGSMRETLIVVDEEAKIKSVNKATCALLGYKEEEIVGKSVEMIFINEAMDLPGINLWRLIGEDYFENYETYYWTKDRKRIPILLSGSVMRDKEGNIVSIVCTGRDINERKHAKEEREKLISQLQKALAEIKQLSGLLPICSSCKKIRDDQGYWNQIEVYIREHSQAEFSHGLCPDCLKRLYPEYADELIKGS